LLVQRKEQRNTPRAARPALRSGSASGPGISVGHIHLPYGNAVIHDGALRVLPAPPAVPHGGPKTGQRQRSAPIFQLPLLGPLRSGSHGGQNPAGAAHRTCAVFGRGRMPRPKIPVGTAHPPLSGGRTAGVCFFCLLFFAQAKKSKASAASGTMPKDQSRHRPCRRKNAGTGHGAMTKVPFRPKPKRQNHDTRFGTGLA